MTSPWITPRLDTDDPLAYQGAASYSTPSLLTTGWNDVEKFLGINGKTTANTTGMTDQQAAAAKVGAQVRNLGALTAVFGGLNQAVGSFYAAKTVQYQEKSQASSYQFQSDMAAINARSAEYNAESVLEAGKGQVMRYTMQAGQEKAAQTASTAARGIQLGSGSAQEAAASQDIVKDIDVLSINSNATRAAWEQRQQATGYRNQALISNQSAQNASLSAKSVSPGLGFTTSLLSSATQFASQWDWRQQLMQQLSKGGSF